MCAFLLRFSTHPPKLAAVANVTACRLARVYRGKPSNMVGKHIIKSSVAYKSPI